MFDISSGLDLKKGLERASIVPIGHFRIHFSLHFKTGRSAKSVINFTFIHIESGGKASLIQGCIQTRLMGQYQGPK